jgi:hypothetical protein
MKREMMATGNQDKRMSDKIFFEYNKATLTAISERIR